MALFDRVAERSDVQAAIGVMSVMLLEDASSSHSDGIEATASMDETVLPEMDNRSRPASDESASIDSILLYERESSLSDVHAASGETSAM